MTMGWMSHYRGRSCGRVLYGLEVFCESNHRLFETATVGSGEVKYYDEIVATYTWPGVDEPLVSEDLKTVKALDDRPLFTFFEFDRHSKGLAARFTEAQFQRRPYMDDRQVLMNLSYTIQEVRNCLTFDEALHIRHIRDYKDSDLWDTVPEFMKLKICVVLSASSHGYITEKNVDWKHIALCAIYSI